MSPHRLTKFRIAVYGVLIEDGRVLLTDTRVPSGIITNFPGGGLELGEAPLEALVREFREETALEVRLGQLIFCSQLFQQNPEYPHEQLMHIYYLVHRVSGTVQTGGNKDDVVQALWVARNELPNKRILAVDQEFVHHPAFHALW